MRKKAICLLLGAVLALTGCGDIGLIGGADGPTAVFVTGLPGQESQQVYPPEESRQEAPRPEEAVPAQPDTGYAEGEAPYEEQLPQEEAAAVPVEEEGTYNSLEEVSLYLYLYGHLPDNYITKSEARDLGWTGGAVDKVVPGCAIGGDRFGNREGILPEGSYHECDIGTDGASSRGAKRLVYSDEAIYYTEDHYESFTRLDFYEEDGVLTVGCEGDGHHEDHHG